MERSETHACVFTTISESNHRCPPGGGPSGTDHQNSHRVHGTGPCGRGRLQKQTSTRMRGREKKERERAKVERPAPQDEQTAPSRLASGRQARARSAPWRRPRQGTLWTECPSPSQVPRGGTPGPPRGRVPHRAVGTWGATEAGESLVSLSLSLSLSLWRKRQKKTKGRKEEK